MIGRDFEPFVVAAECNLREAMSAINDNYSEVVVVVDDAGRALGVITDGDIRRGLLQGLNLESPAAEVMTRRFVSVPPTTDRAAALDLMKALAIRHLPILDDGRFVGLHLMSEILGAFPRSNRAVVMAGGKGTRLRPVTESQPKPMIRVAGRPILERIILHLVGYGVRHIYLAINYRGEQIESHFGDGSELGCRIEYIRETRELGTAGPLSLLPERPNDPIIVMNGDQITRVDIGAMLDFHRREGSVLTLAAGPYQHEIPFGTVEAEEGRLKKVEEKPTITALVNRGIYVLDPAVLAHVPSDQAFTMIELIERLQIQAAPMSVYVADDDWIDVGRPADLAKANGHMPT